MHIFFIYLLFILIFVAFFHVVFIYYFIYICAYIEKKGKKKRVNETTGTIVRKRYTLLYKIQKIE